jgi:hypothetical protein
VTGMKILGEGPYQASSPIVFTYIDETLTGQRQVRSSAGPSRMVQQVENIDLFRY